MDRIAIVTGASSGIARATAIRVDRWFRAVPLLSATPLR